MKRGIVAALSLFFVNIVSAQFFGYGGGYGSFSISNFFNTLDPSTVVYGLLFLILFTLIYLALSRMQLFKGHQEHPNTAAAGVVAFAVAALIVYYLYRSGYNIQYLFYGLGFSGDIGSILLVILLVLASAFIIIKFKLPGFFIIGGLFLMLLAIFTEMIYEKEIAILIGFGFFVAGIFMGKKMRSWARREIRAI